jgi:hypothetical protein
MTLKINNLVLVESIEDIRSSILTFNNEAPMYHERYKLFIRKAQQMNWVYDPVSNIFGPSKFVGYKNMNFEKYELALTENQTRITNVFFHGSTTKLAIENQLKQVFVSNEKLATRLKIWAENILPEVTNRIDLHNRKFVSLSK